MQPMQDMQEVMEEVVAVGVVVVVGAWPGLAAAATGSDFRFGAAMSGQPSLVQAGRPETGARGSTGGLPRKRRRCEARASSTGAPEQARRPRRSWQRPGGRRELLLGRMSSA